MSGKRQIIRAVSWLKSRFVRGGLILLYHRIAKCPVDPFSLCVTPERFQEQMAILRKQANPLRLDELVSSVIQGSLPPRSVAVTFDDGYADALYGALPVLTRYEIPATVFVTTGNPGQAFWWDRLAYTLTDLPEQQTQLNLNIGENQYQFKVDISNPKQKSNFLRRLYALAQTLPPQDRNSLLQQVENWTGRMLPDEIRAMTSSELSALASSESIQIGAHTVHHPVLSILSPTDQLFEIQNSRESLEKLLGITVSAMSYPFGLPGKSYTTNTMQLVQKAGYKLACSVGAGVVHSGTDCLQLPRFWIQNWTGKQLENLLSRWWG